jgi:hemin uptake protein HemP
LTVELARDGACSAHDGSGVHTQTLKHVSSAALLGAIGQLSILHNGEHYLLRRTKQGKLILTK